MDDNPINKEQRLSVSCLETVDIKGKKWTKKVYKVETNILKKYRGMVPSFLIPKLVANPLAYLIRTNLKKPDLGFKIHTFWGVKIGKRVELPFLFYT